MQTDEDVDTIKAEASGSDVLLTTAPRSSPDHYFNTEGACLEFSSPEKAQWAAEQINLAIRNVHAMYNGEANG
jgi:hypothetical protein